MISAQNLHSELNRYILMDGMPIVIDLQKSQGSYIYDAKSNIEYLDLFSFFASQPIGFNHPKLNTAEFRAYIAENALHRPSLSDVYTQSYAQAVADFAKLAGRDHFKHYFFIEGGALGVENALKAAFDWKVRKNLEKGIAPFDTEIIHFEKAFHGRSGYTLSLTNTHDPKKYIHYPRFNWPRIPAPAIDNAPIEILEKKEHAAVQAIKQILTDRPNRIAAVIIEPIQGEGGDRHFRPQFLQQLRTLADENEFLLIFDEVQTGMGLTGKMWCFEHFDFKPDLIAYGKKVQVAGCASTERIDEVKDNVFQLASRINSTWGSNLVDLIRMQKMLNIMVEENLVENARIMGEKTMDALIGLQSDFPRISHVRGRGLMIAFDLPDENVRNQLRKMLFDKKIIVLGCGEKSLRLRPHLDFSEKDLDHFINGLKECLKTL